jgi:hypothetical protein
VQQPFRLSQEARHRVCALSTHDSLPVTDHRVFQHSPKPRAPKAAPRLKPLPSHSAAAQILERMPHTQLNDLHQLRQKHVANGEWALLNTLDAHVAIEEKGRRLKMAQEEQQRTREALDAQMKVCASCNRAQTHHLGPEYQGMLRTGVESACRRRTCILKKGKGKH